MGRKQPSLGAASAAGAGTRTFIRGGWTPGMAPCSGRSVVERKRCLDATYLKDPLHRS